MKKIKTLSIYFLLVFSACNHEPNDGQGSKLDDVVTGVATDVTPFSVTLNGVINNYSQTDVINGQYGFLYTTESTIDVPVAEQLFKQYVAEGSATGCKIRYATTLLVGNQFSVEITGLQPENVIYYCALFTTKDNKILIGNVQNTNFRTEQKLSLR